MFSIASAAVFSSKAIRLYSHLKSLETPGNLACLPSLFYQDVVFLLLYRLLLSCRQLPKLQRLVTVLSVAVAWTLFNMACMSISFYFTSGTEMQWRNVLVALDPSWWPMLPEALLSFSAVAVLLLLSARALQEVAYSLATATLELLRGSVTYARSKIPPFRKHFSKETQESGEDGSDLEKAPLAGSSDNDDGSSSEYSDTRQELDDARKGLDAKPIIIGIGLALTFLTLICRPSRKLLIGLSWSLPLLPIAELSNLSGLAGLQIASEPGSIAWENITALAEPIPMPWLPENETLAGFEDWYETDRTHYDSSADPLKISNLDEDVLDGLRGKLKDINIRHVIVIVLESTRKDVFPLKKDGWIWERLVQSFDNETLPEEAEAMLSNLTTTANLLTGDYDDGFEHAEQKIRGGINANNAHTGSTYTLKSLVATMCGMSPLVVDFNVEHENHFYQPCMPHIFKALNTLDGDDAKNDQDFTTFPWRTSFMQTAVANFDKQQPLMSSLGFTDGEYVMREYLEGKSAKFGPSHLTATNYFSIPEIALEDYIRDAFKSANESSERVFLSHLTSTTHHDWGTPKSEKYVPLSGSKDLDVLSRYLNTIRYADRWLQKILDILDEVGAADDTLLILTGDHGTPVAEGGVATYNNPNTISYQVPLVFSHPKLPQINLEDAVTSLTAVPTLLDLLIESGSLSKPATNAARDLAGNLEGQSLLRHLKKTNEKTGQGDWQFTVTNPGGTMLSVRDGGHPHWHLIVPLDSSNEWRFVDLESDPDEQDPDASFDLEGLRAMVSERENGIDTASWIDDAAVVSQWWIEENKKRWRYGEYADEVIEVEEEADEDEK